MNCHHRISKRLESPSSGSPEGKTKTTAGAACGLGTVVPRANIPLQYQQTSIDGGSARWNGMIASC
jgi:hypothetical protein